MSRYSSLARRLRRDERGAALVSVLGLMIVGMLVTTLILTSVVTGLGQTTATRAGTQSEAAAEAGINVALVGLQSASTCGTPYNSTVAPAFTASVSYTTNTSSTAAGAVWEAGCPTSSARFVKIISKGTPVARGVNGNKSGDVRSIEAIYSYIPAVTSIPATGSAVYTYSSSIINNVKVLSEGSRPASIAIRTGSVDCTETSIVQGDIRARSGFIKVQEKCAVEGSVIAGGTVDVYGRVGGDVSSASTAESMIAPSARIGGAVKLAGSLNAWSPRCPSPNNTWDNPGNACAAKLSSGATSVQSLLTGSSAPTAPVVPDWVDFASTPSAWTNAGYSTVTWPGDSDHCTIDQRTKTFPHVTALSGYTSPTLIDARACSSLVFSTSSSLALTLKTDIAFLLKKGSIEGLSAKSSNTTKRELRFVVPDAVGGSTPTCDNGNVDVNNTVVIDATVAALIYTPCAITNSAVNWRGQMFAGNVQFNSSSGLTYAPIGLPGVDLGGTVAAGTPAAGAKLGTLVSRRDLAS